MPTFQELLDLLRNPGDDGPPETIYDDLTTQYDSDISGASAKIDQLTATNDELNSRITALQAANWELHEQIPKAGDDEEPNPRSEETLEGEELDIDNLFETVED